MVYCEGKLIENVNLIYKSNRPHFLWVYYRKACESRAVGE